MQVPVLALLGPATVPVVEGEVLSSSVIALPDAALDCAVNGNVEVVADGDETREEAHRRRVAAERAEGVTTLTTGPGTGGAVMDENAAAVEVPEGKKGRPQYEKLSHRFANMKQGAQRRFEAEYKRLKTEVEIAWAADAERALAEFKATQRSNNALAELKRKRTAGLAAQATRDLMKTVFTQWRIEIDRIISTLGGWKQDDGNVLFPDGSVGKNPKGLYIPKEDKLSFE